jgi:hypothetical protein
MTDEAQPLKRDEFVIFDEAASLTGEDWQRIVEALGTRVEAAMERTRLPLEATWMAFSDDGSD